MSLESTHSPPDPLQGLVRDVLTRGEGAVERFLCSIGPSVLRVVRQVLGVHHTEVPDVMQEACVAIIDSLERFRGESTVLHFVWRVAALTAMNARRKCQLRERFTAELTDLDSLSSLQDSPYGLVVAARRREAFRHLLDELPAVQADALTMHCVLGFTVEEAAQASGVPANTLRSRLITARASLRKRLGEDPEVAELLLGAS